MVRKEDRTPSYPHKIFSAVVFCLAFCLLMTTFNGCSKKPPQQAREAEVTVMTIKQADTPMAFEFVAQTQSSHEVQIRARVSGFLEKRVYTEGTVVKQGSTLFLMDKKPFQAQVNAAAAALTRQKSNFETARRNLERVKPLAEQNALSQKDLDDAKRNYETSAAEVDQAKAQLEMQQLDLSYCTITSPITGITSAAMVQDGAYVNQQNNQLTTVSVLSPMWVNFSISENDVKRYADRITSGQIIPPKNDNYVVEIILVDGAIFSEKGMITFAAPSYDPKTGTFLLRSSFPNTKGHLRPNQYVRARLKGAVRRNAVLIPQRAVQQGAKGHFVWVVNKEGKAEFRPVTAGDWYGDDLFIDAGLQTGDQIVIDGMLNVRQGAPVKIKQAPPVAEPTGKTGQSPAVKMEPAPPKPAAKPAETSPVPAKNTVQPADAPAPAKPAPKPAGTGASTNPKQGR
ncbi:MAG: efflux transporter, family, subunit [Deltaproteobacteria bacterium]|nr:efflux transporter, family, subunit [Deltaproteobacteria bacterium]